MKYTSAEIQAASLHLEAVSERARQVLVVGGVATNHQMAMDYAKTFGAMAKQQGVNTNLEPAAMTLPHALENPDELLGLKDTYIIALSAGNIAVCRAFQPAGECEQPLAITGQGAPTGDKDFKELLRASLQGMREVPIKYRLRGLEAMLHLPTHWFMGKEAANFSTLEKAIAAKQNKVPYDLVDFDRDRFFGHTEKQLAEAAVMGVNVYQLQGVHNEHFRNGGKVASDYMAHAAWRASHQGFEELASV